MSNILKTLAAGSASEPTDEYFNQTTLLLHGDGTNGAQNNTFLDSSTNNFTITRNGNTTQGTFSPFSNADGEWSNYFDGTSDYLQAASNADFQFGTGEFVIEGWYYFTGASANYTPLFSNGTFSAGVMVRFGTNSDLYINGTQRTWTGTTGTFPFNSWNHVCLVRTSTTVSLFINGTRVLTATDSANISPTSAFTICDQTHSLGSGFTGYVNNFRTIKGDDGPYDATQTTITVPTAPFTANTTNQVLLTCYSNRFIDANTATTAKTITANGNVAVQPFSPFAPSAAYSPSVNSGSAYFDRTGDRLNFPDTSVLRFEPNDFTIECWINPFAVNGSLDSIVSRRAYGVTEGWFFGLAGNLLRFGGNINSTWTTTWLVGNIQISANTWTHVAVTKSGTSVRLFVNGVLDNTGTLSTTSSIQSPASSKLLCVGDISYDTSQGPWPGYISNFRILSGTALYTASFTPPTSPLTAVTNTQALLNFTNAGIYDSTAKNNLETVGNAQVDTSVVKYGTGSMKFDGTGDALTIPASPNFAFGTGDFTIEFWAYFNSIDQYDTIYIHGNTNNTVQLFFVSGKLRYNNNSVVNILDTTTTIPTGQWVHLAIVRSSGTATWYLNGTADGTVSDSTNWASFTTNLTIGRDPISGRDINGYIDDLRITKGVARYTANFTPPTAPFPDQ